MAATIRTRSGLASRFSSLAALLLIRIEKLTPNPIPIQHRIAGIAEPLDGDGEIVEVLKIAFDGLADDFRPASPELSRGRIQRVDQRVRQSCGYLLRHWNSHFCRSHLH